MKKVWLLLVQIHEGVSDRSSFFLVPNTIYLIQPNKTQLAFSPALFTSYLTELKKTQFIWKKGYSNT